LSGKQAWLRVLSPLDLGLMAPFSFAPPVSLLVNALTHHPWLKPELKPQGELCRKRISSIPDNPGKEVNHRTGYSSDALSRYKNSTDC
jgi:hypothetical protein